MTQASRARARMRIPHVTLNSDGQRHPVTNALAVFTLVVGIVAMAAGFLANQGGAPAWAHVLATWAGLAALVIGLYTQLISATREERVLVVTGLVAAFIGVALGLAHGGLSP
jgi:hypothetical protein